MGTNAGNGAAVLEFKVHEVRRDGRDVPVRATVNNPGLVAAVTEAVITKSGSSSCWLRAGVIEDSCSSIAGQLVRV